MDRRHRESSEVLGDDARLHAGVESELSTAAGDVPSPLASIERNGVSVSITETFSSWTLKLPVCASPWTTVASSSPSREWRHSRAPVSGPAR